MTNKNEKAAYTKFTKIHNDKYIYTIGAYKGMRQKMDIVCPEHGVFSQLCKVHAAGHGCPKCGIATQQKSVSMPDHEWISKFVKVHSDEYDYSVSSSISSKRNFSVRCKVHGVFQVTGANHVHGSGCPSCAAQKMSASKSIGYYGWIEKFKNKFGDTYTYPMTQSISSRSKVHVICKIHGSFQQFPDAHLSSNTGCPKCGNTSGFRDKLPGTLYYLSINNGQAYKIGITNKTIETRYTKSDLQKIQVLKTWDFPYGKNARIEETAIKRRFKELQYTGKPLLRNGNTELFSKDILQLDNIIEAQIED